MVHSSVLHGFRDKIKSLLSITSLSPKSPFLLAKNIFRKCFFIAWRILYYFLWPQIVIVSWFLESFSDNIPSPLVSTLLGIVIVSQEIFSLGLVGTCCKLLFVFSFFQYIKDFWIYQCFSINCIFCTSKGSKHSPPLFHAMGQIPGDQKGCAGKSAN